MEPELTLDLLEGGEEAFDLLPPSGGSPALRERKGILSSLQVVESTWAPLALEDGPSGHGVVPLQLPGENVRMGYDKDVARCLQSLVVTPKPRECDERGMKMDKTPSAW